MPISVKNKCFYFFISNNMFMFISLNNLKQENMKTKVENMNINSFAEAMYMFFLDNYGFISIEMSQAQILDFVKSRYLYKRTIPQAAYCLADYLLANAAEAQE